MKKETHIVNIHAAKTHLSRLIREVVEGGEVVIAKGNVPLVKLVLIDEAKSERVLGTAKSTVKISKDFDEPIEDFSEYA